MRTILTRTVGNPSVRMESIAEGSQDDQDVSMSVLTTATQEIAPSLEAENRKKKKKKTARLLELEENRQRMKAARAAESTNARSTQGMPIRQEQMNFPTQT